MTSDLYSAGLTFARCAFTGGPRGTKWTAHGYKYIYRYIYICDLPCDFGTSCYNSIIEKSCSKVNYLVYLSAYCLLNFHLLAIATGMSMNTSMDRAGSALYLDSKLNSLSSIVLEIRCFEFK